LPSQSLHDDDESVRSYAIQGLAAVGDDGAWAEVLEILQAAIVEQVPIPPFGMPWETLSLQSTVLPMICYLGRHLGVPGRCERVTKMGRENWSHLYTSEQRWFDEFWPECNPERPDRGSAHPDPRALSEWAHNPCWRTSTRRADAEQSPCSALVCGSGGQAVLQRRLELAWQTEPTGGREQPVFRIVLVRPGHRRTVVDLDRSMMSSAGTRPPGSGVRPSSRYTWPWPWITACRRMPPQSATFSKITLDSSRRNEPFSRTSSGFRSSASAPVWTTP